MDNLKEKINKVMPDLKKALHDAEGDTVRIEMCDITKEEAEEMYLEFVKILDLDTKGQKKKIVPLKLLSLSETYRGIQQEIYNS